MRTRVEVALGDDRWLERAGVGVDRRVAMTVEARFGPAHYVEMLHAVQVPGYTGSPDGKVSINRYLSANTRFGGANHAWALLQQLQRLTQGTPDQARVHTAAFGRVFSGQGMIDDMVYAMSLVIAHQAQIRLLPQFTPFFSGPNYLQAMIEGYCFGLDCIGFIGTYLVAAGVHQQYQGRRPLDYMLEFRPVQTIAGIKDLSIVAKADGQHIQIIEKVLRVTEHSVTIDLCQSTSWPRAVAFDETHARGPQFNRGLTITDSAASGGGDYLPVEQFRAAMQSPERQATYKEAMAQLPDNKKVDFETYLRQLMTQHHYRGLGYQQGGLFNISGGGTPANPVGGWVYVGTLRDFTVASSGGSSAAG
jgi:hypothetical protein